MTEGRNPCKPHQLEEHSDTSSGSESADDTHNDYNGRAPSGKEATIDLYEGSNNVEYTPDILEVSLSDHFAPIDFPEESVTETGVPIDLEESISEEDVIIDDPLGLGNLQSEPIDSQDRVENMEDAPIASCNVEKVPIDLPAASCSEAPQPNNTVELHDWLQGVKHAPDDLLETSSSVHDLDKGPPKNDEVPITLDEDAHSVDGEPSYRSNISPGEVAAPADLLESPSEQGDPVDVDKESTKINKVPIDIDEDKHTVKDEPSDFRNISSEIAALINLFEGSSSEAFALIDLLRSSPNEVAALICLLKESPGEVITLIDLLKWSPSKVGSLIDLLKQTVNDNSATTYTPSESASVVEVRDEKVNGLTNGNFEELNKTAIQTQSGIPDMEILNGHKNKINFEVIELDAKNNSSVGKELNNDNFDEQNRETVQIGDPNATIRDEHENKMHVEDCSLVEENNRTEKPQRLQSHDIRNDNDTVTTTGRMIDGNTPENNSTIVLKCPHCSKNYKSQGEVTKHLERSHFHKCFICDSVTYLRKAVLRQHMARAHGIALPRGNQQNNQGIQCINRMPTMSKGMENIAASQRGKQQNSQDIQHIERMKTNSHHMEHLDTRDKIQAHSIKDKFNNGILCPVCGLFYPNKTSFWKHLKITHNDHYNKEVIGKTAIGLCPICGKRCTSKYRLMVHLENTHRELHKNQVIRSKGGLLWVVVFKHEVTCNSHQE